MIAGLASTVSVGPVVKAAIFVPAGVALGAVHFGALAWNTRLYLSGGIGRAFAIQLGRFGILVCILSGIARLGALPLLWAVLGALVGRVIVVRRFGRLP